MSRSLRTAALMTVFALAAFSLVACGPREPAAPSGNGVAPAEPEVRKARITMVSRSAPPEVAASLKKGQRVRLRDSGQLVGEIVSVETTDTKMAVSTSDGRLVVTPSPLYDDVTLVVEAEVQVSENGIHLGRVPMLVGSDTKYLTPYTVFGAMIVAVEPEG